VNDPAELQRRLADATDRLLATAEGLTDGQAREPSPGRRSRGFPGLPGCCSPGWPAAATARAWPRTRLGRCPRCPHG